jgi:hypothetical protein
MKGLLTIKVVRLAFLLVTLNMELWSGDGDRF